MHLILWRHAEAEVGKDDLSRQLTSNGCAQAKAMSKWLAPRLPANYRLLVSQAKRSQQTAAALSSNAQIYAQLNPNTSSDVWQFLQQQGWQENLIIVGHQPWLGKLASQLLNGVTASRYWSVKKGAIWWFKITPFGDELIVKLNACINPKML